GGTFLRAREPLVGYVSGIIQTMNPKHNRLIARFEEVDALHPTSNLTTAARSALRQGYETQLCLVKSVNGRISAQLRALEKKGAVLLPDGKASSSSECVSVLVWPGPRVRNELRISEEIAERRKRGVNTGLGIHADCVPLFLTEYLLRLFSL